jgi:hypothetical protein
MATVRLEVHAPIIAWNYTGDTFYGTPVVVGADPWADDSDATYATGYDTVGSTPARSPSGTVDLLDSAIGTITAIRYFIRYSTTSTGPNRGFFYEWWPTTRATSSDRYARIPYFQDIPGRENPNDYADGVISEFTETMFPDPDVSDVENVAYLEEYRGYLANPMTVNFWSLEPVPSGDSTTTIYKTWIEVDYTSTLSSLRRTDRRFVRRADRSDT